MEIITVTEERIKQVLPTNIIETDVLSKDAKKALATIINYLFVYPKAKSEGFLVIPNSILTKATELGYSQKMLAAVQELIDSKLVIRKAGMPRQKGEHRKSSEYYVIWENLKKPIKKDSFEELFKDFLKNSKSPETPISTPISIPKPVSKPMYVPVSVVEPVPVAEHVSKSISNPMSVPVSVAESVVEPKQDNLINNSTMVEHNDICNGTALNYKKIEQDIKKDEKLKASLEEGVKEWFRMLNNRNSYSNG